MLLYRKARVMSAANGTQTDSRISEFLFDLSIRLLL